MDAAERKRRADEARSALIAMGVSPKWIDEAEAEAEQKWLELGEILVWIDALKKAETGDTGPLIALGRSMKGKMPPVVVLMLMDLIERRALRRKQGGQRTPLFALSAQQRYAAASEQVDWVRKGRDVFLHAASLVRSGKTPTYQRFIDAPPVSIPELKAIRYIASQCGLNARKLMKFRAGKTGFSRAPKRQLRPKAASE